MNENERATIKKIQKNLLQISLTGRAPINLTQYLNLGLIRVYHTHYMDAHGIEREKLDRLVLTDKAKKYLQVTV